MSSKSLPATPDARFKHGNPFVDRRHPEKVHVPSVDYAEVQELVNTLELANDKLLDDNRMLTKNIITKNSIVESLEQKIDLVKQQNINLVAKNIEVSKLNNIQKEKSETSKNIEKQRTSKINSLELELEKEQKKLKQIHEKFEKSKHEILQLNKGINRKIDQVRKLSFDAKENDENYRKAKEIILTIHVKFSIKIKFIAPLVVNPIVSFYVDEEIRLIFRMTTNA